MIATIFGAFRVADIRKKILFTAAILALYRLGTHIPAPGISESAANQIQKSLGSSGIRSEERRVGKECVRLCRSRWSPYH